MVLYEDLRIYTIWRTDMARAKASNDAGASSPSTSNTIYSKSAEEWEILGELAERLHHVPEAIEAYQSCLRIRFSPKAMRAVVKMWEEDRKTENVLQGMIRLIAWQYRWYSEVCIIVSFDVCVRWLMLHIVLAGAASKHSKAHRGGRSSQGEEYCAGDESAAACTGSHTPICRTMCYIPK